MGNLDASVKLAIVRATGESSLPSVLLLMLLLSATYLHSINLIDADLSIH
jgi:hypothetical protein